MAANFGQLPNCQDLNHYDALEITVAGLGEVQDQAGRPCGERAKVGVRLDRCPLPLIGKSTGWSGGYEDRVQERKKGKRDESGATCAKFCDRANKSSSPANYIG